MQIREIAGVDPELKAMVEEALTDEHGGDRKSATKIKVDNVHLEGRQRPDGNSAGAALRRLRKDKPDLYADVRSEAGQLVEK
jgi:hypothetical protein